MGESEGGGERLHSTVRLNQFTLQFEDGALESAYQAGLHTRKKALWLRSLVPAAASHVLFALADCLDHPPENLLVTLPARVFLVMLQISMFVLVQWDLVLARERTMLLVSIANGIPTLVLYSLQRASLHQWDALFVTFGLSFYTIPKITPLGYVSSFYGSWLAAAVYALLAFVARPPPRSVESALGFFFLLPMVWVFNTISYYSELSSRERFALRRRLRRESITLAVACTAGGSSGSLGQPSAESESGLALLRAMSLRGLVAANSTASFIIAVLLWAAFTLGGWTSLPEPLKFVDEATGWAWFSHCAGVTVFLVVMTRRLRWLFVVPVGGALLLYIMSLAMPASWIIVSAHSVGYGLLLASVVIAMGVFSWFVCAWKELVSFLTRTCFLYPQLQDGMENEYPLLVRIVSEYTAAFDPEILSARVATATAMEVMGTQASDSASALAMDTASSNSPRRRRFPEEPEAKATPRVHHSSREKSMSDPQKKTMTRRAADISGRATSTAFAVKPSEAGAAQTEASCSEHSERKMVSVLPSFKPGKCFFCSKNDAEHFVPACGMWGKWTHWRMNQQQGLHPVLSTASSGSSSSKGAVVVSMCTSYYDLQNDKSQLESRLQEVEDATAVLEKQLASSQQREQQLALESMQLKAKIHALEDKHEAQLRQREVQHQAKLEDVQTQANSAAHKRKVEAKKAETALVANLQKRLETSERLAQKAQARAKSAEAEAAELRSSFERMEKEAADWKAQAEALASHNKAKDTANDRHSSDTSQRQQQREQGRVSPLAQASLLDFSFVSTASGGSSMDSSPLGGLQTLQPSGRLPYAQSLEIEGLRESSRQCQDDVDYSMRWRFLSASKQDDKDMDDTSPSL